LQGNDPGLNLDALNQVARFKASRPAQNDFLSPVVPAAGGNNGMLRAAAPIDSGPATVTLSVFPLNQMPPVKSNPEASWPELFYPIIGISFSQKTPYRASVRGIFLGMEYRKRRREKPSAALQSFNGLWTEWNKAPGPHHPRCDPALCSLRSAIWKKGEDWTEKKKPQADFRLGLLGPSRIFFCSSIASIFHGMIFSTPRLGQLLYSPN